MFEGRYICLKCGNRTHTPRELHWVEARVGKSAIGWVCRMCIDMVLDSVREASKDLNSSTSTGHGVPILGGSHGTP